MREVADAVPFLSTTDVMATGFLSAAAVSYVVGINFACFLAFAWDKRRAQRGQRRLRERNLLLLAGLGGSVGALAGQHYLRHKTRKQPFRGRLRMVVGLQAVVLAATTLFLLPI